MNTDLSHLLDVGRLDFRAACNEALPPDERPVKPRVLKRISRSPVAQTLVGQIVAAISSPPPGGPMGDGQLWKTLVADPQWKTFVLECVTEERHWADLANPAFGKKIWDRLKALVEKWWSLHHPATRAAGTAAISLASVVAASHVINVSFKTNELQKLSALLNNLGTIRLAVAWDQPPAIPPVHFAMDDLNNFPGIRVASDPLTLKPCQCVVDVHLKDDGRNAPAVVDMSAVLGKLDQISGKLRDDSSIKVDAAPFAGAAKPLTNVVDAVGALDGEVKSMEKKLGEFAADPSTQAVRNAVFARHITLINHRAQSFVLPQRVGDQVKLVSVSLAVKSSGGNGRAAQASVTVNGKEYPLDFAANNVVPIPAPKATIVLNGIDRRVPAMHLVRVTISPSL